MSVFIILGLFMFGVLIVSIFILAKNLDTSGAGGFGFRLMPYVTDWDGKQIGRLAGKPIYKSDTVDIPVRTGFFGKTWIRDVPTFAIINYDPPATPHKEGLWVILPHTYGKLTGFKLWDDVLSLNEFWKLKSDILTADLDRIKKMVDLTMDKDALMKEITHLRDHMEAFKTGMTSRTESMEHSFSLERKPEKTKVLVQKAKKT